MADANSSSGSGNAHGRTMGPLPSEDACGGEDLLAPTPAAHVQFGSVRSGELQGRGGPFAWFCSRPTSAIVPAVWQANFTPEERAQIQHALGLPIHPERVCFRAGPGGSKVRLVGMGLGGNGLFLTVAGGPQIAYLDQNQVIQTANSLFGFDGWAMEIRSLSKGSSGLRQGARE
jgi:hypothetical protein